MSKPSQPSRAKASGKLYSELNARYFGGRLPPYRIVRNLSVLGEFDGRCDLEHRTIRIKRGLSAVPERERQTLLHEMIHVAVGYGHGAAFQEQLAALARQGERWAERERRDLVRQERRTVRRVLAVWFDVPQRVVPDEQVERVLARSMRTPSRT